MVASLASVCSETAKPSDNSCSCNMVNRCFFGFSLPLRFGGRLRLCAKPSGLWEARTRSLDRDLGPTSPALRPSARGSVRALLGAPGFKWAAAPWQRASYRTRAAQGSRRRVSGAWRAVSARQGAECPLRGQAAEPRCFALSCSCAAGALPPLASARAALRTSARSESVCFFGFRFATIGRCLLPEVFLCPPRIL